ncbi:hypothetical protein BO99DRAFT_410832 [Aspergillus violaceofuscus CBS 115571]|uniref:Uncharacterized protein n=1 Tax=Aspergillus violaceofuscus (strain CBS 115571) TaxID=1450538 RepID=A0A2V5HB63_ASPV1|nr:hypothetical protein BO99DRAFT_410832 [Aspergillus violaceofuscus CBS 115571]
MDLQGQPIPPGHRSTKVTSDPERYEQPIQEPSGPVTKDSLAAESATKGGAFAQNRGAQPMGVSGQNSTVTNTDTSNARKIEPASQQPQPQSQQPNTDKIHPHQHQPRHNVGQQQQQQQQQQQKHQQAPASGSGYQGGVAPSYVHDVLDNLGNTKPKGTNLQEGDIPDDAPNASYTTDIGSENDPGRLAQGGFQLRSAESGPAGTPAGRQKGVDDQQPFQALQSDQRA